MKKHYTYVLQLVLLTLFIGTSFHAKAENNSIIDSNNALYQLKRSFIKTLIDEDLEKMFERRDVHIALIPNCPTVAPVNVIPGTCGALVSWPAIISDTGNIITQPEGLSSGSIFPIGETENKFEERDILGRLVDECVFIVTVIDNEAPVPDAETLDPVTAQCEVNALTAPTATDNCGGTVTVTNNASLPITAQGTTVITWTYEDTYGNISTQDQDVIILDTTAPVPDTATLDPITAQCEVTALTPPTATDNCNGTVTVTNNATLPITAQGATLVIWTYTDVNGNASTQNQNVVITDNIAPVPDAATLGDVTAQCEVTALTAPTATDNCGGTVTVTNNANLPLTAQGTTVVIWTYTDVNGNESTQNQNVVIMDTTAPVADPATLGDVTAQCEVTALTSPTATDNCGGTVIVTNNATLPITTQGTTIVTWTFDDGNGNIVTADQNVIVDDTSDPVIPTLADITVGECSGTPPTPTTTDNCAGTITGTTTTTFPITTQGTTIVTWIFDDGNGNSVTADQNVTVVNTTAPVIPILNDVTGECSAIVTVPTTTDNCGIIITGTTTDPLSYTTQGSYIVTWNFDDGNGNDIDVDQNVIVLDTITPVTPTLADVTVGECSGTPVAPTTTDNCAGTITGTTTTTFPITTQGTTVVTWTFDDGNGNVVTADQNVIVDDTNDPVTPTLADVTVGECSGTPVAPTTTDNCAGTITGTTTTTFPITTQGTTVVTWNFDDGNGNNINVNQNVIVLDITPPTFTSCLSSFSATNDLGICGATVNFTIPTATDNCGTAVVAQTDASGLTSGSVFPIGTTTLEFTATDANGLTNVCTFTVTVTDDELPTIVCPDDITVSADANCEVATLVLNAPTTDDNCGIASITNNLDDLLPLYVGSHTVTWTVIDSSGNINTCTQAVEVVDNTPPVIICSSPNAPYPTDLNKCTTTLSLLSLTSTATVTDNCNPSPTIKYKIEHEDEDEDINFPFDYDFPTGTTTVVIIADDEDGNISTCKFDVVVVDNQAPIAACQLPFSISLDASGNATITPEDLNNGSSDNCGGVLSFDIEDIDGNITFNCTNIGDNLITLIVTDASENTSTCSTTVTVLDNVQAATASISASLPSPICSGTSVTFTASATDLGASPQYEWFVGGASVGNNSATFTTSSLANGDDVYVEITSGPCATITTSNSINMNVSPLLPVSFTLNASKTTICNGETANFFITSPQNFGDSPTYLWRVNGASTGVTTATFSSSSLTNNQTVSVEVTSSAGCANPITRTQSVTMTVSPNSTITNPSNRNQTLCINTPIAQIDFTLTDAIGAVVTGLPAGVTGSFSGGVFRLNGAPTQPGVFNYTVTPTGCGSATRTGTITVNPNATLTLISPDAYEGLCNSGAPMTPIQFQLNPGDPIPTLTRIGTPTLPTSINGSYNAATGVYTIQGSTNTVGTFQYRVTTNGCGPAISIDGVIKVFNNAPAQPTQMNNEFNVGNVCDTPSTINLHVPLDSNAEYYTWTFYDLFGNVRNGNGFEIVSDPNSNSIDVYVTAPQQWILFVPIPYVVDIVAHNPCGSSSVRKGYIEILELGESVIEVYTPDDDDGDSDIIYVCEGTPSVTMAGKVGGLNYSEWEWSDNDALNNTGYFEQETITITEEVCTLYILGFCIRYRTYTTTITTETTTSEYFLPTNATAGDIITISLIGNGGTYCTNATDNLEIRILAKPTATITNPDVVCAGEDIVVTGTPNTTVTYTTDGVNSLSFPIDATGTTTFHGLDVGTYTLTSIAYNDVAFHPSSLVCSNAIMGEFVTINEAPSVDAGTGAIVCEGGSLDLTTVGATISGTNAAGSWTSSGSPGTVSGNIYTPSTADANNGSVTLTYTNTPSDGICSAVSDTMVVTINPLPTVYAGIDQTICADSSIILNGTIGGGAISSTWSAPSGTFSDVNSLSPTYTPSILSGQVILTLTANNPQGCGPVTSTIEITVNPAAIVNAGAPFTVCSSDTITLNGTKGGSATSTTWSSSTGGNFEDVSELNTTYTPTAEEISNGSVLLTLTSNKPSGACNRAVASVLVTINQAAIVDAGATITTCSTTPAVSLNATSNNEGSWSGGTGTFDDVNSLNAIYTLGAGENSGTVTLTFTTEDPDGTGPCNVASDTVAINVIPFVEATVSAGAQTDCSNTTISLIGSIVSGLTGTWSAVPVGSGASFSFSNINDPNATFTGESGAEYEITWTLNNLTPCGPSTSPVTNVIFQQCGNFINFDGYDDSVDLDDNYDLSGSFSIEAWIKPNVINNTIQTIISKRNATSTPMSTGYDLRLTNGTVSFRPNNSPAISAGGIVANIWQHVAVTYDGTTYTIYVNGVQRLNRTGPIPTANSFNMRLGAMSRGNNIPTNHFNGWLNEIRIWNTNLNVEQIRLMMNQKIKENGLDVIGAITGDQVPTGLLWSNLDGYYQMNLADATGSVLTATEGVNGRLVNMDDNQEVSAPLPYITSGDNTVWDDNDTWLNGDVQMLPNSGGVSWNIVRTKHNVNISRSTTVLGLVVSDTLSNNAKLSVINDQPLYVTKYLKINSTLDLVDESQLLQPEGSIVDYTGTGELERDQQGTGNTNNYNYWGSPVSSNGPTTERTYSLDEILYDGDLDDVKINWISGHDGAPGSPVSITRRWLYTYNGLANNYNTWNPITETTSVEIGLGFLMKGADAVGEPDKNYTFKGQPNNGTIEISVAPEGAAVVGNPYPSAIDSWIFYDNNQGVLKAGAALQFWEQAPNNATHVLAQYRGRYSYLVKTGSVPGAYAPGEIANAGNALKSPQRYIPVGQGFFVTRNSNPGMVVFKNEQRIFMREGSNSVFLRTPEGDSKDVQNRQDYPDDYVDDIQRVRLAFKTPEGAIRHLLLGFLPDNSATDGIDYGFDALNGDDFPSDLSFIIEGQKFVIQGVGAFDINKKYPLHMTVGVSGSVELSLTDLENFDEPIDVYVYDAVLDTYTRINEVSFQLAMKPGNYPERFSIVFRPDNPLSIIDQDFKEISVKYLQKTDEIYVKTPASIEVRQLYLINMAGQAVKSWNMTNMNFGQEFKIPVKDISEGNYILQVETNTNSYNKKIIIKF